MDEIGLMAAARKAAKKSYSPYSHFAVGAALQCADGTVYTGANIENASFGATVCAERNAVFSAVLDGKKDFAALAVSATDGTGYVQAAPCGICLQVLHEFCPPEMMIYLDGENQEAFHLYELLPHGFSL